MGTPNKDGTVSHDPGSSTNSGCGGKTRSAGLTSRQCKRPRGVRRRRVQHRGRTAFQDQAARVRRNPRGNRVQQVLLHCVRRGAFAGRGPRPARGAAGGEGGVHATQPGLSDVRQRAPVPFFLQTGIDVLVQFELIKWLFRAWNDMEREKQITLEITGTPC